MIIKKVILKNIRSYEDGEINFPQGITLLSGDIGSGKSTILLSIEFALFGIKRGEMSGSALLRNGKDLGYIILNCEIAGKDISIKRSLKRQTSGIVQDSGYLSIDDITQQLTPTELKQKILELLNYPAEMLTKKSIIYRYTVYTPQEEMKTILLGEKELRIETLRRAFNIDKYQRIKENCKILISELKIKKKESAAFIYDLEDKKQKLLENEQKIRALDSSLILFNNELLVLLQSVTETKNELSNIEVNISHLNTLKREFEIIALNLKLNYESKIKNQNSYDELLKEIEKLSKESTIEIDVEAIKKQMFEISALITKKEKELKLILEKSVETKMSNKHSEEIKTKISNLGKCPLCEQEVTIDHKNMIISRENKLVGDLLIKLNSYLNEEKIIEDELENTKSLLENLKQKEKEAEINKVKISNLKYKKELFEKIAKEIEKIDDEISALNNKKADLNSELEKLKDIEKNYTATKNKLEGLQNQQKKVEIEKAKVQQELENIEKINQDIKKDVEEKEKVKAKLEYYIEINDWLENFFINMVGSIERKVMLKIYYDFSNLFQNWFYMLMDTENIKMRLDEEFTPIINQNGYDTEYENLSGGEKTACALAYRLALNQVINNLVANINTKDIIILDEPTDGFSSEQLDKLRNVLHELKMKQIIAVSHESKIETFVDNIIKIEKAGHISRVIS